MRVNGKGLEDYNNKISSNSNPFLVIFVKFSNKRPHWSGAVKPLRYFSIYNQWNFFGGAQKNLFNMLGDIPKYNLGH